MIKEDVTILPEFLVILMQDLREDPFEKLLNICKPLTEVYASRYFYKDYEYEDILQEARKVLVKTIDEYRIEEGMAFMQFYQMKLQNHLNMLVRKEYAQIRKINTETFSLENLMEEAGEFVQGTAPIMTHPEEVYLVKEKFEEYMVDLSPFEKHVFSLFIEGTTIKEAAKLLDCSETKVKNAWYRCGIKFKDYII